MSTTYGDFSNDPALRKRILSGKYGDRPKELATLSSDAEFQVKGFLFLCKDCKEMTSKENIVIRIGNKEAYRPVNYCRNCGKKMKELNFNKNLKCPECGKTLAVENSGLWD